jgi:hypothetical protein
MTGKRSRRHSADDAERSDGIEVPGLAAAEAGPEPAVPSSSGGQSSGGPSAAGPSGAEAGQSWAEAGPSGSGSALSAANTGFVADDAVVRRTKDGWRVGSDDLPDLTCAMILADLLAAENGMPDSASGKPGSQPGLASEAGRLRATVSQLEHALLTRIRVEQAIGVLAERHRIKPRQAFEQLREAARSRGRRVIDIAGDVVASATNPLLQLPDELSRPRTGPRRTGRQQPSGAQ